jgi:FeS assembly SUF system protein
MDESMQGDHETEGESGSVSDSSSETGAPQDLKSRVIEVLQTCYDPEIPVNIYELGLVYHIDVNPSGAVVIQMTLTSPACPVAGSLPPEIENKVMSIDGVSSARVDVVWEPPWSPDRMSDAARLQLGML